MAYDPYSMLSVQGLGKVLRTPVTGRRLPGQQAQQGIQDSGRFERLLSDPAFLNKGQSLLNDALGSDEDDKKTSLFEGAVMGSMNLLNTRALATLTRVLTDDGNQVAADPRLKSGLVSLRSAIADAVGLGSDTGQVRGSISWDTAAKAYKQQTRVSPDGMGAAVPASDAGKMAQVMEAAAAALEPASEAAPAGIAGADGAQAAASRALGWLAAQFESGTKGVSSIGYDRHGGTSYGKYQISSRAGSMDAFIRFLHRAAPEYGQRLAAAGPANTGGKGGSMPREWKKIAAEDPDRFESLQNRFVRDNNFLPALRKLTRNTAFDRDDITGVMGEVLWSTAVQHGPTGAARIFRQALGKLDSGDGLTDPEFQGNLIRTVYDLRSRQFGSSTSSVRSAVQDRLGREMELALSLIGSDKSMFA
ncbi:hypothetical protein [Oleidesulfovibrio sp.]|uniref:VgrG-related protein n=1 Tax=Oleidesulfovibrio sp. TaxID=2909707 RepID=UPI003A836F5A